MTELPKNFPEYSIMYKTLSKKIQELQNEKTRTTDEKHLIEIQQKISQYQNEAEKIKSKFPENFFDD
jgi:hypothetical protein